MTPIYSSPQDCLQLRLWTDRLRRAGEPPRTRISAGDARFLFERMEPADRDEIRRKAAELAGSETVRRMLEEDRAAGRESFGRVTRWAICAAMDALGWASSYKETTHVT